MRFFKLSGAGIASLVMLAACGSTAADGGEPDAAGPAPGCGDGTVNGSEVCDPLGNPYCASDCSKLIGRCHDGIVQPPIEDCDPGNDALRGCTYECKAELGFTCGGDGGGCVASGLPENATIGALTPDQQRAYCVWLQSTLFQSGNSFSCSDSSTTYTITRISVDDCVQRSFGQDGTLAYVRSCTMQAFEDWVGTHSSICNFALDRSSPACATVPAGDAGAAGDAAAHGARARCGRYSALPMSRPSAEQAQG